jgi:hypothetical protein
MSSKTLKDNWSANAPLGHLFAASAGDLGF